MVILDIYTLKFFQAHQKTSLKGPWAWPNPVSVKYNSTPDGLAELSSTNTYQKDIMRRLKWIKKYP